MRRALWLLALCGCGSSWTPLSASLDRPCLSAWGTSAKEVFLVGGGLGNGLPAQVLHLSGGKWSRVAVDTQDSLWWAFGFSASDVYWVGENGAAYHYDGNQATRMTTPTQATLFGVWGSAPGDVWAVGGTPGGLGGPTDVLLHHDGTSWKAVAPPKVLGAAYFKVWGSAANDVFVVGEGGVILHYDGTAWAQMDSPVHATLLTVSGRSPSDVWAVGGPPTTLVHFDGQSWTEVQGPALASGLSGVSAGAHELFVAGLGGVKWRQSTSGKWSDDTDVHPTEDLHAVWAAPDGSAFVVGGDYLTAASPGTQRLGVAAYYGSSPPPPIPPGI